MRVSLHSLEVFSHSMATCLAAGLSPTKAFLSSAKTAGDKRLTNRAPEAVALLEGGAGLADALAPLSKLLPHFYIGTVRCGEEIGRTVEAFEYLRDHCRRLIPASRIIRKTWLYPLVIIAVGWVARLAILVYFAQHRRALGLLLDTATLCGIACLIYLPTHVFPRMRRFIHAVRLQLPVLRETDIDLDVAVFLKTFNLMYQTGGTGVARMADLASTTIRNSIIREDFQRAAKGFEQHDSFEKVFGAARFLNHTYKGEIAVGATSGKLDEALDRVADLSDQALAFRLELLNRFLWRVVAFNVAMGIAVTFAMCTSGQ